MNGHQATELLAERAITGHRDDGAIATAFGRVVEGRLPPLLPAIAGATVTIVLAGAGLGSLPGITVLAPIVAMLLAGLGTEHPHNGRLDWLVPPVLRAAEYIFVAALALTTGVSTPVAFGLLGAIAFHHYDVFYRIRVGRAPSLWLTRAGLGWEGRMLVVAFGAMFGIEPLACEVLAAYLWMLFGWESLTSWAGASPGAADRG